ncbi:MAG: hypothetical protein ACE5L6_02765 [Candidatus Bathyarchaeia archaeon]
MPTPALRKKHIDRYRRFSQKLASPDLLSELRRLFERRYTLPELLEWLHSKVEWSKGKIRRHNDPKEILNTEKEDAVNLAFCSPLSA